jgi:hypothetical protein
MDTNVRIASHGSSPPSISPIEPAPPSTPSPLEIMPPKIIHPRATMRGTLFFGALALLALLSLIVSPNAPASAARRGHSSSHGHIARSRCVLERVKRSKRAKRVCVTTKRSVKRVTVVTRRRGLIVEEVGGSGGGAPTPPSQPPAPVETPKSKAGKVGNLPVESGETVSDPIDPRFLTETPFGTSSFWIQPWRAYLDTWPASRLLEAVGINFNVTPADAEGTAQLLQDSGFKLARIGINWSALSYSDPTSFIPERQAIITKRLTALRDHGLRPLIVLDAYSGAPTPAKHVNLETTAAASAGAETLTLTPASAAEVVPGKTGFNNLIFGGAPDMLISSLRGDVAVLSRPLKNALSAGPHPGTTLLYAPFASPTLANGAPNPVFQATLAGWLNYVAQVCKEAASVVGPGGFDLEVWNELDFGSQFLNSENYYGPGGEEHTEAAYDLGSENGLEANASAEASAAAEAGSGPETEQGTESENGPETEGELEAEPSAEGMSAPLRALTATHSEVAHKRLVSKEIRKALLDETVAFVRDPANGVSPEVGITDGFASQTPFPSGANAPLGLTALSKHPYVSGKDFPAEYHVRHIAPLDALGSRDTSSRESFTPLFTPAYQSLLPEYTLTATSTETLIRDLAPFTTDVYHFPHGREVGPAGGPPLQKWVTEYNLGIGKSKVMGPDEVTPETGPAATLTPADKAHFEAKVVLRSLVSMVSKGMSREYFFAAAPGNLSLINEGFFSALEADPGVYPGDALGGETMTGLHNMLTRFQGPGPSDGAAQQLTLLSITQNGNHAQFTGDGTPQHPSLYDRDVLAVFPFQTSPTSFVIPVYVMTRDLLTLYEPNAPTTDIHRFDLPNETFHITLGNLPETTTPPTVTSYDPLLGENTPAHLTSHKGNQATFEIQATDYPRLLTLNYG